MQDDNSSVGLRKGSTMSYGTVDRWIELHKSELDLTCRSCGRPLSTALISGYPHDDGYQVIESMRPVWLYITCNCGYRNALAKLGVPPGMIF